MTEYNNSLRVVFMEESAPGQYLKLIFFGPVNDDLLEALDSYIKRQRSRLASDPADAILAALDGGR